MRCQDTTDPGTVRVPLYAKDGTIRAYTLIDADDAGLLGAARWRLVSPGYAARWTKIRSTTAVILLHRVILEAPDGIEVDHINRDGLDNRRCNLRLIPHAGNMQNRPSHRGSRSAYRGVYWDTCNRRWRAQITVDGKRIRLGRFATEEAAAEAAKAARARLMPFATD